MRSDGESSPVIEVSRVSRAYRRPRGSKTGRGRAIDDVSFRVAAGESVALLGPNGAGKSTMMRMLSGVLRPSEGTISCLGETPARRSRRFLMRTSLIMGQKQRANLDVPLRASLELQRVLYDISRDEFDETLARFEELLGVGAYIDRPVRTLSLGERMRGELAMGLLHLPELVLLDEPTIGLDAASQRSLRGFLREYNRETGATIILTSHYMEDVEAVCDRALLLDGGRLVFDGSLQDMVSHAPLPLRVGLTLDPGRVDEARRVIAAFEHREVPGSDASVFRFDTNASSREVVDALTGAGVAFTEITIGRPDMNDLVAALYAEGGVG